MFISHAAAAAKSLQSCPTLCDPIDGNPPGSPVPGILQARTLEWAAISFSNAWKWKVKVKLLSHVRLLATPWTSKVILTTLQASLQQYMNWELPDVQAGFRKGRGTRDQIANNHWTMETSKGIPKTNKQIKKQKHAQKTHLLFYWVHKRLWLRGSQKTVENS